MTDATAVVAAKRLARILGFLILVAAVEMFAPRLWSQPFHIEEASITDIQHAIQTGQTSCKQVVQAYIARARVYNGVCTALLTKDGAPIPQTSVPASKMATINKEVATGRRMKGRDMLMAVVHDGGARGLCRQQRQQLLGRAHSVHYRRMSRLPLGMTNLISLHLLLEPLCCRSLVSPCRR